MHYAARVEEHYDNIAAVLLGTFESSEEERPYLEALDAKYEALRTLLLTHQLRMEHGVGWDRYPYQIIISQKLHFISIILLMTYTL